MECLKTFFLGEVMKIKILIEIEVEAENMSMAKGWVADSEFSYGCDNLKITNFSEKYKEMK